MGGTNAKHNGLRLKADGSFYIESWADHGLCLHAMVLVRFTPIKVVSSLLLVALKNVAFEMLVILSGLVLSSKT